MVLAIVMKLRGKGTPAVCGVCGVCSVMFGDGTLDEAVEGMCNEAYNQRTMSPVYGYGVL